MKRLIPVAVLLAIALMPAGARAQERVGDAALGALSGAVVLDPWARWPVPRSAIQQDLPSPIHGGCAGTDGIIIGATRDAMSVAFEVVQFS
jgi:hypothetical protein